MKKIIISALALSLVSACSKIPPEAYFKRGEPQSLISSSTEEVNFPIYDSSSLDDLVSWIEKDQPSFVEISCSDNQQLCLDMQNAVAAYGVEYEVLPAGFNEVKLSYNRIVAKVCENRFINNTINPYNLNHPTFGCTTATNIVMMVADRNHIVNPPLLALPRADKAAAVAAFYLETPKPTLPLEESTRAGFESSGIR
jgi:hypothetical protein